MHIIAPSLSCPPPLASAPHTSLWGLMQTSELRVLSLPGLALVHTHRLEGMQVCGLAADPCGTALAVCDLASQFHARPGLAAAGHAAAGVAGPYRCCLSRQSRQRGTGDATAVSALA